VATFFICGWSTNGLIGSHFIPAAHDHGMPATTGDYRIAWLTAGVLCVLAALSFFTIHRRGEYAVVGALSAT